jgi:8-oxo-dGTP pyrophosphatase MutT (NUDIX family)
VTFEVVRRRLARMPRQVDASPLIRWAAVAVVIAPSPDALLVVRRAERLGDPWSGQMALPGGRKEEGEDLLFTALRETEEEVGLVVPPESLLGVLDDVAPISPVLPPIAVRPVVFRIDARPPLIPNVEVAEAQWVPLETLLHPETYAPVDIEVQGGIRRVSAYRLAEGTVWGMTERILSDLLK